MTASSTTAPSDALDFAIAGSNDHVYVWYADGTVSSGTSGRLDAHHHPHPFTLPSGKKVSDVRGIGIAGSNDHVYAWYADGTVSSGTSTNLDAYRKPYAYSLPSGKSTNEIVAMAIAGSNDHVYCWYSDGTVSSGTSSNLDAYRSPYPYTLPPGRSIPDIVGIGIAGSNDHVYAWYRDGTVSSGTSANLDAYLAPYRYRQHAVLKAWWGPSVKHFVKVPDDFLGDARDDSYFTKSPILSRVDKGGLAVSSFPTKSPTISRVDKGGLAVSKFPDGGLEELSDPSNQFPPLVDPPFEPSIQGVDPMVAVGRNFVLVSQQGSVEFLDRSGNALPTKDGVGSSVTASQLFAAFLDETSPTNINHFVGFPQACDGPTFPQNVNGGRGICIFEPYDLRTYFDAGGDRFIVVGQMRNYIWWAAGFSGTATPGTPCGTWKNSAGDDVSITWTANKNNLCGLARRHVAIAVSKTEDPRDGFHLYALTENNYRDFPWATINGDSLVIANRGKEMPDGPVATVLSLSAMRNGAERVPFFRYYRQDLAGNHPRLLLPVHHGNPGGLTLMYATGNEEIRVFGFPPPAKPYEKPPLVSVVVQGDPVFGAVFRNNFLYFASHFDTGLSPNMVTRNNIRVTRVPLWAEGSGQGAVLKTSTSPTLGYRTRHFGLAGPGDVEGDIVSYEETALAVTKNGDMVVGYGRFPVVTQQPLFPEVRYTVWYHDEDEQRPSKVLKKGAGATTETPAERMDYAWAAVDPVDDLTVWIAHEYAASSGNYRFVVGKVRP